MFFFVISRNISSAHKPTLTVRFFVYFQLTRESDNLFLPNTNTDRKTYQQHDTEILKICHDFLYSSYKIMKKCSSFCFKHHWKSFVTEKCWRFQQTRPAEVVASQTDKSFRTEFLKTESLEDDLHGLSSTLTYNRASFFFFMAVN